MMTPSSWLPAAMISLACFGLWGFFCKLSIQHISAKSALLFQSIGFAFIGLLMLAIMHLKPDIHIKGITFAMLAGMATGIGGLFFFIASDLGKVTTVVTMTSLYPLVTLALAYFILHESIDLRQGAGIIMALAAIYLLS